MKKKMLFFGLLVMVMISYMHCGSEVYFTHPQPEYRRNISKIPEQFTGKFLSTDDSSVFIINSWLIIRSWTDEVMISREELNKELDSQITQSTIWHADSNLIFDIQLMGDSAFVKASQTDTIFVLKGKNLLRKYQGYYFLNQQIEDEKWKVMLMRYHEDTLSFCSAVQSSVIDSIRQFVEVEETQDTTSGKIDYYTLHANNKELKTIMKKYLNPEKFVKIE